MFLVDPSMLYALHFDTPADGSAGAGGDGGAGGGAGDSATNSNEGTNAGDGAGAASGEGAGDGSDQPDPSKPLDGPLEGLAQARAERIAAENEAARAAQAEAERIEREAEDRLAATITKIDTDVQTTAKAITDALSAIKVVGADGTVVKLTPEQLQSGVFDHVTNLLQTTGEAFEAEAFDELVAAVYDVVPTEAHDALDEAISGKNLEPVEWLKAVSESTAPHTKAWKDREAEFKETLATERVKAWEDGAKSPSGMPRGNTGSGGVTVLTRDGYLGMTPAERQQAVRERPAEVDALLKASA